MSWRYEIRLSGEGGQGLVLAGRILAEAAAIHSGLNATQSQSYGPEARGGHSKSEVILSDDEIDYPKAVSVDFLLALTQESYNRYRHDLKPGAIVLVDESVKADPEHGEWSLYQTGIVHLAQERLGRALFANIVAVGLIGGLAKILDREALQEATKARVPKGTEEKNLEALAIGFEEAARLFGGTPASTH